MVVKHYNNNNIMTTGAQRRTYYVKYDRRGGVGGVCRRRRRSRRRLRRVRETHKPAGGPPAALRIEPCLHRCRTRGARRLRMRGTPATLRRRRRQRPAGTLVCCGARVCFIQCPPTVGRLTRVRIRYLPGVFPPRRRGRRAQLITIFYIILLLRFFSTDGPRIVFCFTDRHFFFKYLKNIYYI